MNDIKALFEIDFQSVVLGLITFMIGFIALKKVFTEFLGWLGIETKFMRDKREQKEDIEYLKKHNVEQDKKIDCLMKTVDEIKVSVDKISKQVDDISESESITRRNTIRDRLNQSFRYYSQKGQWTTMEKEAFEGLVASYESAGGINGTVHSKIIPASLEWKIIDE